MKRNYLIPLITCLIVLNLVTLAFASVEWNIQRTFKIKASPVDAAVSRSGRWIFVLTDKGDILIYSKDGNLEDRVSVGNHVDRIKVGFKEDILLLTSRKNKSVQVLTLEFIHNIDVSNSPFRGPVDAPVVIAVFNDFQ